MKVYKRIRKTLAKFGALEDVHISHEPIWSVYAKGSEGEYIFECETFEEALEMHDKLLLGAE